MSCPSYTSSLRGVSTSLNTLRRSIRSSGTVMIDDQQPAHQQPNVLDHRVFLVEVSQAAQERPQHFGRLERTRRVDAVGRAFHVRFPVGLLREGGSELTTAAVVSCAEVLKGESLKPLVHCIVDQTPLSRTEVCVEPDRIRMPPETISRRKRQLAPEGKEDMEGRKSSVFRFNDVDLDREELGGRQARRAPHS